MHIIISFVEPSTLFQCKLLFCLLVNKQHLFLSWNDLINSASPKLSLTKEIEKEKLFRLLLILPFVYLISLYSLLNNT